MTIHNNTEYIKGFIEGLFEEFDIVKGPFLSKLNGYEIQVLTGPEQTKVIVRFNLPGIEKEFSTDFNILPNMPKDHFRNLVDQLTDIIINFIHEQK